MSSVPCPPNQEATLGDIAGKGLSPGRNKVNPKPYSSDVTPKP